MRNKLYTQRVEICMSPRMLKEIQKIAKNEESTVNEIIRRVLDAYIK